MIRYSLVCSAGHEFEGWFGSNADFETQRDSGLLSCPQCATGEVSKAVMAPSVKPSGKDDAAATKHATMPAAQITPGSPELGEVVAKLRELRSAVLANTEDVGKRFGEEARKIHYGETEARGIRGQTDLEEARKLIEEGIDILPVPQLPEDKN